MLFNSYSGLNAPVPYAVKKLLAEPTIGPAPSLLYGVELEIEGCSHTPEDHLVPGLVHHRDGSLRNNGAEFVTKPMAMRELRYVLGMFFNKNKFNEENYSERCSVHVHANIGDLGFDEIQSILTLYLVFERLLFRWIGQERNNNIFCVPLHETLIIPEMLSKETFMETQQLWSTWPKYTALNLRPMYNQSTIEFRHMGGTHSLDRILTWCSLIGCLFSYAKDRNVNEIKDIICNLNTSSFYTEFLHSVFGDYATMFNNTNEDLERGVISVKYALMSPPSVKKQLKATTTVPPEWLQGAIRAETFRIFDDIGNAPAF
jgi:hypothetical protein